jgi:hypothetical protein
MAVLMTAEVPGMTQEAYEEMLELDPVLRSSPGFVCHAGGSTAGGWRITEVWKSREDFERFFEEYVKPNLPPGIEPTVTFQDLHTVIVR